MDYPTFETPIQNNENMLKLIPFLGCFFLLFSNAEINGQVDKRSTLVAFYNLENLFDTINNEGVRDGAYTPGGANAWGKERYANKLDNMSKAISIIGSSEGFVDGPDILGLCEVENLNVLEDLLAHKDLSKNKYQIVHSDSPDPRGIDVAFLYKKKKFKFLESKSYPLYLIDPINGKRIYTRDQLLVVGEINKQKVHIIVNHWPSRWGGERNSRPLRMAAAQLSRHIADSLLKADSLANIILMGDLNDDPTNQSVEEYLYAGVDSTKLKGKQLYNASAPMFLGELGSLYYRGNWNMFDQIIISQAMLNNQPKTLKFIDFNVERSEFLIQQDGAYKNYPLRTFGGKNYLNGYSDHLPVYIIISKK